MRNTHKSRKDGCQTTPTLLRKIPDIARCRVKSSGLTELICCLVADPSNCEYIAHDYFDAFCFHPKRNEILARSEASQ